MIKFVDVRVWIFILLQFYLLSNHRSNNFNSLTVTPIIHCVFKLHKCTDTPDYFYINTEICRTKYTDNKCKWKPRTFRMSLKSCVDVAKGKKKPSQQDSRVQNSDSVKLNVFLYIQISFRNLSNSKVTYLTEKLCTCTENGFLFDFTLHFTWYW